MSAPLSHSPSNIEDISKQASNFEYNAQIPLRHWLRSADTLQKEAQIYNGEGNDSQTYLLLLRHAILVLEKLSQHPEAKNPSYKKALSKATKIVDHDFKRLEILKPRIENKYAKYIVVRRRRTAQQETWRGDGASLTYLGETSLHARNVSDSSFFSAQQALEASENQELAARLAHREIRRRDGARRAVRQAGVSEQEEQERRVGGHWGDWEHELVKDAGVQQQQQQRSTRERGADHYEELDLSRKIQEAGQRGQGLREGQFGSPERSTHSTPYRYPKVPVQSRHEHWDQQTKNTTDTLHQSQIQPSHAFDHRIPPQLPPKPIQSMELESRPQPPPIPGKYACTDIPHSVSRPDGVYSEPSEVNSRDYTFKPTAHLENGTPLRPVFIPPGLRSRFVSIASGNTNLNLETCGVLCGTLISNALFISKLVIPEQTSTSDTCETVNEEAMFDYCDEEGLMVLGWIHTHPTQTCFMSSRDLHTHSGYQVMLAESIAIVCAPSKDPSWGVFRLTDPPGLKTILGCSQSGLFHPHSTTNTYTDASKPGHVVELPGLEFEVKDLRPGH